jgi:hypothetical protein
VVLAAFHALRAERFRRGERFDTGERLGPPWSPGTAAALEVLEPAEVDWVLGVECDQIVVRGSLLDVIEDRFGRVAPVANGGHERQGPAAGDEPLSFEDAARSRRARKHR